MDPFDPVRNEEGRRSKRRTSILKVPRKSIVTSEAVQQDKVVECVQPLDKRISRRVSFAPANDVHLFANPLQELMPGGTTQNAVQMNVTEDQQFTGLDAFLNTPKQIFQRKDQASASGSNFEEKTIMFHDMDMTQCDTMKITHGEELLNTSYGFLHGHGEKTIVFDRSMDMTFSQTISMSCDQGKPTPSVFPFTSSTITQGTEFFSFVNTDKENLVPQLNRPTTKKMGGLNVGLISSEDDLGVSEANPLQCLYSQEIYAEPNRRKSRSSSKDNVTCEPIGKASNRNVNCDTKDDGRSEKTIVFSGDGFMDITQNWTSNIEVVPSASSTMDKSLKERKGITPALSVRHSEKQERVQQQEISIQRGSIYKSPEMSIHQIMIDPEKTVRFSTNDACMDVTSCHTVKISADLPLQPDLGSLNGEKTVRFTTNDAGMDITQCVTVNIARDLVPDSPVLQHKESSVGSLPAKSVDLDLENFLESLADQNIEVKKSQINPSKPFMKNQSNTQTMLSVTDSTITRAPNESAETCLNESSANMENTKANKFHNASQAGITSQQRSELGIYPNKGVEVSRKSETHRHPVSFDAEDICRERTMRFDSAMDTTQCHTVNITNDFEPSIQDLPKSAARFHANNPTKHETKSVGLKENRNMFPISGEKTLRFSIDDANMDVTKSHTMMTAVDPQLISDFGVLPRSEDKTVQFSSEFGGMEVTQCLTSNIGIDMEATRTDLSPLPASITMGCPALKKKESLIYTNRRCRSSVGHGANSALKARRSVPWGSQAATSAFGTVNVNINAAQSQSDSNRDFNYVDTFETPKAGVENGNMGFMSVIEEKSMAEISQKDDAQENRDMNITEALPVQIHRQTLLEEPHPGSVVADSTSSTEEESNKIMPTCDVKINVTPEENNENVGEVEETIECAPSTMENDSGVVHSQKSRRRSLANIQSKIRRISQMLTDPPDNGAMDGNPLVPSLDREPKVEVQCCSAPIDESDASVDTKKGDSKLDDAQEEPLLAPTTPYRLETKQLMSRLSVVGCKPKLPRRSKCEEAKTPDSCLAQAACKSIKTQTIQDQVGNFDLNVSDINDEELGSYEDVSETLDKKDLDEEPEMITSFHEFELDQELQDEVFEDEFALVNERKRPSPHEEDITQDKRVKTCNEADSQTCTLEGDNIAAVNTQTVDSSNCSQTASLRCEATFESSSKQSLFESQLEDYVSDIQRKCDAGTVTMAEFFKLFHIDFVIHNPRQSMVSGKALSDTESTLLDLSHDRHISLPKQLVYEANVRNLTEQVEGFKVRLRDLDKPLTLVNRTLWEEMEHFTESEFKSFGAKLKEKHSLYRKMSKAQSHEMKGLLYSDLIQTNVDEQKKLRGSIEKADAMLKNLDECIAELEADLATVDDDVKSHQEELNKVTDALANQEKATLELEILQKQNENKVRRVKDETKNLDRHLDMLHTLNEWKLVEIRTNLVIYTFLHETLHLVLAYEQSKENTEERKIEDISFKHLLDERSQCHARLVHTLVSQFTQEKKITRKYSTSKHVPQLLHDISLVVSRCRQLGEELRQLKTWGSLRFDILDIHCLHSDMYIVFSSLKRFAKFEVVFGVSLTNQLCALELKSFKNIIGSTTIQQIEEIVSSSTPGQNHLTNLIKNIHSSLLC